MTLSAADLARLEAASRLLVSPLAAPCPEAWIREAGGAVRDLVGGTGVVLQLPQTSAPFLSEDAPEVSDGVIGYVEEVEWDGTRFSDPVVDEWNRLRRQTRLETFCWDVNMQMVREKGLDPNDAPIITEVLQGQRFNDFAGMMGETPEGEAMIWVLHRQYGAFPFGEHTARLLSALMPSFRSGLDALGRLGAHRAALDAAGQPLVAFSPDGRELHRTPALTALLDADPERAALEVAIGRLGLRVRHVLGATPAGASPGDGPAASEATVLTARGRYVLRVTALPPGLFGADPTVLVTVAADRAPAPPSAEAVRGQHGLTQREAEVALLLAEGLRNADIADRLFISPHTVRRHVENVLAKLDVPSRAAIAGRLLQAA